MTHIKHFNDLDFTVVAEPHSHYVSYKIYDIVDWREGSTPGVYDVPAWNKAGSPTRPEPVWTLAESEPFMSGSVKWDGCSNWFFDEQTHGMIQGCCREDIQRLGDVLGRCWDWTSELCEHWD